MVGLGIVAAWLAAAVTGSFWARKYIGQQAWRKLHFASFAAFVLSWFHGITAGTDTTRLPVTLLYAVSMTTVLALLTYRISRSRARSRKTARPVPARLAA
jgi:DMSO/TMAO reductase YedYZ heme-binding membrane subunit